MARHPSFAAGTDRFVGVSCYEMDDRRTVTRPFGQVLAHGALDRGEIAELLDRHRYSSTRSANESPSSATTSGTLRRICPIGAQAEPP